MKFEVQAETAKLDGGLFFFNSVGLTVRLNRLFQFFKNTYTQYNDLMFGLYMPEALITP